MRFQWNLVLHVAMMLFIAISLQHCEGLSIPHLRRVVMVRNATSSVTTLPNAKVAQPSLSSLDVILAGGLARLLAQLILHPLDAYRTRVQLFGPSLAPSLKGHFVSSSTSIVCRLRDFLHIAMKGVLPLLLLAGPAGALQFSTLEVRHIAYM